MNFPTYRYSFNYEYNEDIERLTIHSAMSQEHVDEAIASYSHKPIKDLYVIGDWIDHLVVPEGVETVACCDLGLKTLILPESVEMLYADNNRLKSIELPAGIIDANLKNNLLEHVTFKSGPYRMEKLTLFENRLASLEFKPPDSLCILNLQRNFELKFDNMNLELQNFMKMYDPNMDDE